MGAGVAAGHSTGRLAALQHLLVLLWLRLLSPTFLVGWQLAAQLGCVLLRRFQLDLDLGTCRVPRLAGVWVG